MYFPLDVFSFIDEYHVSAPSLSESQRQGHVHGLAAAATRQHCPTGRYPPRIARGNGQPGRSPVLPRWRLGIAHRCGARLSRVLRLVRPTPDFTAVRWRQAYAITRYRSGLPVLAGLEGERT